MDTGCETGYVAHKPYLLGSFHAGVAELVEAPWHIRLYADEVTVAKQSAVTFFHIGDRTRSVDAGLKQFLRVNECTQSFRFAEA